MSWLEMQMPTRSWGDEEIDISDIYLDTQYTVVTETFWPHNQEELDKLRKFAAYYVERGDADYEEVPRRDDYYPNMPLVIIRWSN